MYLTPKDEDRLLLFLAAELARKRRAAGLRLTYPEARALIADEIVECARRGLSVAESAERGSALLTDDDVCPGVRELLGSVQVEGFFEDGQKLVTVHDPVRPGNQPEPDLDREVARVPGEIFLAEGDIEINAGKHQITLTVDNTGDRPVQIGSHFHFFEVNRALRFDRRAAFGRRLDIPSGTAVRFEAGASKTVDLVPIGGSKVVVGLNDMTDGPVDGGPTAEQMRALHHAGFKDIGDSSGSSNDSAGVDGQ